MRKLIIANFQNSDDGYLASECMHIETDKEVVFMYITIM